MTPIRAQGLIAGRLTWDDPREFLEAALYISLHPHYKDAIGPLAFTMADHLANYAVDNGEEAAVKLIRETLSEEQKGQSQ